MIQVAAVLAALAVAEKFLTNSLVKRLLENWSHSTTNTVDDWVVDALTGSDATAIERRLEVAQIEYDRLTPEAKAEAKTAKPLPDVVVDVLLTRTDLLPS